MVSLSNSHLPYTALRGLERMSVGDIQTIGLDDVAYSQNPAKLHLVMRDDSSTSAVAIAAGARFIERPKNIPSFVLSDWFADL